MIRTVIFDFDGTLADTSLGIVKTMQATLEKMGLPVTDEHTIRQCIGLPLAGSVKFGGNVPDNRVEEGVRTYRELFDGIAMPSITLFDGVKDTLLELKRRGYALSIATSRGTRSLSLILEAHGISDIFDFIATSNGNYKPKPAPDMVLYILEQLGAKAEETIVIGDTTFDIDMGSSAGCATCAVTYGNHDRATLLTSRPDHIADRMPDILEFL